MIFVDASALVSILAREDDSSALFARIEDVDRRFYSPVSRWESIMGLRRSYEVDLDEASKAVNSFFQKLAFERVSIGEAEDVLALEAARLYGKGRHPASLNMGDCFAYACAKSVGARLLYKGDDFSKTYLA